MESGLPRLQVQRRTCDQRFIQGLNDGGFDLTSFWEWASSDLVSNVTRGLLAEYLVARALGLASGIRDPWQPYDLITPGGLKIEVKSGSYLQSWWQKTHTQITFLIAPTRSWSADNNTFSAQQQRQAHVYVFAVLAHRDKSTLNPLDLDQWEFYIAKTADLDQHCARAKSLSISRLLKLRPRHAGFAELRGVIDELEAEVLEPAS